MLGQHVGDRQVGTAVLEYTMTLPSRFTFLKDTYISEECKAPIFKASILTMEALFLQNAGTHLPVHNTMS
jgi:hypothetical protein